MLPVTKDTSSHVQQNQAAQVRLDTIGKHPGMRMSEARKLAGGTTDVQRPDATMITC